MRPGQPNRGAAPLAVAALLFAQASLAQPERASSAPTVGELAGARLGPGVALRSGFQSDIGPGLSYSGITPNVPSVSAWYFGAGHFGFALSLQREGFGLFNSSARVTGGSLLRANLGAAGRVGLGPLRLEALVGYGFAELPLFGATVEPAFAPAQRHAVLLASRALMDLGPLTVEAGGEFPIPLAVSAPGASSARAGGFAVGAAVSLQLGRSGQLGYGLVVDYQYVSDRVTLPDGTESAQAISRVLPAIQVLWLSAPPPPPPPRVGGMLLAVLDADTRQPLGGAQVTLQHEGKERSLTADAQGKVLLLDLAPGGLSARAVAGGHLPAEGRAMVVAGADGSLELLARKEPPKVGGLVISVVDKASSAPLPGATVTVGGSEYVASEAGRVSLIELPPGPTPIQVSLQGYRPASEVASVVAGKDSPVSVPLLRVEEKPLATLAGLVRSTRGGAPIDAELEIPQVRIRTRANAKGEFTFKVRGGTYTVSISASGYLPQSKTVTVKDGDQAIFNVDLHPK
ncbi:MAG: carboxypeptidase regulatory-like domain-containing protein [Myxococcales bacterium]|nr:carboxypeptidase regulatory-like domain-containing protein [Myxococcales bacterium]